MIGKISWAWRCSFFSPYNLIYLTCFCSMWPRKVIADSPSDSEACQHYSPEQYRYNVAHMDRSFFFLPLVSLRGCTREQMLFTYFYGFSFNSFDAYDKDRLVKFAGFLSKDFFSTDILNHLPLKLD